MLELNLCSGWVRVYMLDLQRQGSRVNILASC